MVLNIKSHFETSKSFVEKHQALIPFITFIAGFLFDVFTISRIDQVETILQQAVFLLFAGFLLITLYLKPEWKFPEKPKLEKILQYRMAALHFIYGSLLSCYTIFYFKSSSFSVSFFFLLAIAVLLVANEFPHFHNLGLGVKTALLGVCLISFFAYVVPILFGVLGAGVFLLSIFVCSLTMAGFFFILKKYSLPREELRKQIFIPFCSVIIVFLLTYFFKVLPPVPLSLQFSGVYHSVEKTIDNKYKLGHFKPWWNFWNNGDQNFYYTEGEPLVVFFRLFAPRNFQEQIHLVWNKKELNGEWVVQDRIPIKISGGRDQGYRGYGIKSNYGVGKWFTSVVTSDDREIGRIYFNVIASTTLPTDEMKYDYQ